MPLLVAALLLLVVGGAVYGAYLFLPTASVTLRPHVDPVGPLTVTVVADPAVAVPDPAEAVVPAETLTIDLAVSGAFPATGTQVSQTRATGSVRFRSENTVFEVPIAAGTRVATASGIAFETTRDARLGRASFESGPTTADVPVRAVRAGPRGNVAADTITVVPRSLNAALVTVRNPRPTSGGERTEVPVVTQEDYDAALETLTSRLPGELQRVLADPTSTPRGLTVFATSARTGTAAATVAADDLVDTVAESFSLGLEAPASVLAVNEALIDQVAHDRLRASVPAGATMLGESASISRQPGTAVGTSVVYRVTASAQSYRLPDRAAILEQLRGRTVPEATAIMAGYGDAELTLWPEFIDRLPDQLSRINLTILPPEEGQ